MDPIDSVTSSTTRSTLICEPVIFKTLKTSCISAFLGYNWDDDLHENLMDPFRSAVERRATGTYCGTKYKLLADPLEKSIKNADL